MQTFVILVVVTVLKAGLIFNPFMQILLVLTASKLLIWPNQLRAFACKYLSFWLSLKYIFWPNQLCFIFDWVSVTTNFLSLHVNVSGLDCHQSTLDQTHFLALHTDWVIKYTFDIFFTNFLSLHPDVCNLDSVIWQYTLSALSFDSTLLAWLFIFWPDFLSLPANDLNLCNESLMVLFDLTNF